MHNSAIASWTIHLHQPVGKIQFRVTAAYTAIASIRATVPRATDGCRFLAIGNDIWISIDDL
jgi:hypothetical protein